MARAVIGAQCDTIIHRGPDDEGLLIDGDFGFGMRRLSLIDIAGGHQPISTPDERFSIVFNGEIYNFPALRRDLAQRGHVFATESDTETILLGFREWGDDVWRRLDGMFAVAIWDGRDRTLTLARDPLGVKPLYITEQGGGLAFGSELKALLPLPGHRFDVSPRAVHDFFSFGHIRTGRSIYAQVRTLPPGHVLTLGPEGDARERSFWRPAYHPAPVRSEGEWIEEFRSRWLETVERHMIADVEVGAFLSGGLDSSAVVAAMARLSDRPIRTFTIGFPVERYNEAPFAEAVARHLGCQHTTRIIDLADARDVLPQLQRCYDEPFADPSAVPTWYLSRLAREQVKAVLSGDGGDELFMGYKRHLTERRIARLPGFSRTAAQGVRALPTTSSRRLNRVLQRWQKAVGTAALPDGACRFFAKTQITSAALRARVLSPDFYATHDGPGCFERWRDEYFPEPASSISPDDLEQFAYGDLTLNLPCAMLTKVDRASMAHSLEVRVPLLSPPFVEWAMGVPTGLKVRGNVGKYLMRQAVEPWLPDGIVSRRKQGFQIPLAEWFDGDFGAHARELWNESGAASLGFLDAAGVDAAFREHREGSRDHGRFLYALSMFSLWWADRKTTSAVAGTPPVLVSMPVAANDGAAANDNKPARPLRRGSRALGMLAMLAAGWLVHDVTGSLSKPVVASTFVDEAVRSHHATLIRAAMRSHPEMIEFDRSDILQATGMTMPTMPRSWTITDVQIYPSDSSPSVEIAIRTKRGETFSIFGMRTDTPAGGRPLVESRAPDEVVYWESGPQAFALVGSLPSRRLLQLAAKLDEVHPAPRRA